MFVLLTISLDVRAAQAAGPTTSSIEPADFAKFSDEQINAMIAHADFPGAAIVLVQNGKVVFERGYGVTNLSTGEKVDPEQTRFRMGSISKIFTTTAVLQLVEQRKLSLDDPIQKYLPDVSLGHVGEGVLIRNLLTHTDGFDVGWSIDAATIESNSAMSLTSFLQTHLPRRILPPGQMYVYSDVGMALAGHIIENVSGESFEQYVDAKILSPLAMTHSTFVQPPPGDDGAKLAQGYRRFKNAFHPVPLEHVLAVPSAAFTVTPADMSRFMLAYLNDGQLDGVQVLQPATARLMQDQQFTHHPALPGTSFGLYERIENGQRALQHGGVLPGFHSQILFIPEQHLGLFITTNAYGGADFEEFDHAFFNRFFAKPPFGSEPQGRRQATTQTTSTTQVALAPDPQDLSGRYRYVQYPHHNLAKLCIFAGLVEELRVRQQPDGTIIVDQGLKGSFAHIGPLLYARGEEKIAFRADADGQIIGCAYDTWAFQKIHWYEARAAQAALIRCLLAIFLLAMLGQPIARYVQRGKRRPQLCRDLAAAACAINLLFLAGMVYSVMSADMFSWYHGLPTLVVALGYIPWLSIALSLAATISTIASIRRPWNWPTAIAHALVLTALLFFPVFCVYWNLLTLPRWLPGS